MKVYCTKVIETHVLDNYTVYDMPLSQCYFMNIFGNIQNGGKLQPIWNEGFRQGSVDHMAAIRVCSILRGKLISM